MDGSSGGKVRYGLIDSDGQALIRHYVQRKKARTPNGEERLLVHNVLLIFGV